MVKKWCRSRDLNPDERNSLPPQDSVSTMFHHFGVNSNHLKRPGRDDLPLVAFLLTPGALFCQHENKTGSIPMLGGLLR